MTTTVPDPLRAALTLSPKFGAALWLGDRLVARISATVEDSRVTPEEPEPRWKRDAMVFVDAVNAAEARPGLDAAWAEVEAALPEGWERVALTRYRHFPADSRWVADVEDEWPRLERPIRAYGPTPAEALRALAIRLTEERP